MPEIGTLPLPAVKNLHLISKYTNMIKMLTMKYVHLLLWLLQWINILQIRRVMRKYLS